MLITNYERCLLYQMSPVKMPNRITSVEHLGSPRYIANAPL